MRRELRPESSAAGSMKRWSAAWALLVATSALYFLGDNSADNDLWVHVRVGLDLLRTHAVPRVDTLSYTMAGQPWVDHEWLTHVLFGAVYEAAGSPGLLILKLAIAAGSLALLARLVVQRAPSPHVWGPVLVVSLAVVSRGFAVRPQIITYGMVVCLLTALDSISRGRRWLSFLIPPLLLLWANLHGAFILGIGMAGLCALWLLPTEPRGATELGIATALGIALALFLNPYGPSLAVYLRHELTIPHPISEWQPVSIEAAHATFFALATAFLVGLPLSGDWRRRGWQAALAAGLLLFALRQQRHTPIFALSAASVTAAGLHAWVERWPRRLADWRLGRGAQAILLAGMTAIALLQGGMALARLAGDGWRVVFDPREYPVSAVAVLRGLDAPANLALPLDWGGYALWHLAPPYRVSLDGRFATVYSAEVVKANFDFFGGGDPRPLLEQYDAEVVLAPTGAAPPVAGLDRWRMVYEDSIATVFVRRGSAADQNLPALVPPQPAVAGNAPFP